MAGLVHLYCGDGKGKTTAAAGLALRAAGAGKNVVFVQFLKNGSSSEIAVLRKIPSVKVLVCETSFGFFKDMTKEKKREAAASYGALLGEAFEEANKAPGLLVLDEAAAACNYGLIEEEELLFFLKNRPKELEVVLTGRDPSDRLLLAADYVTEMRKIRHPYDRGIMARRGVEF